MVTMVRHDVVEAMEALYRRPEWLRHTEHIDLTGNVYDSADNFTMRMVLWSDNEWLRCCTVEATIEGKLLRIASYMGRKSLLIEVVGRELESMLRELEECHEHADMGILSLASQALQSEDAMDVLVDALLEVGRITAHDPPASVHNDDRQRWTHTSLRRTATSYAKHILAPILFGGWGAEPWPLIKAHRHRLQYFDGGLILQGEHGPIRVETDPTRLAGMQVIT